jgi:N-acetylmuramoyl-L-alanine amidase
MAGAVALLIALLVVVPAHTESDALAGVKICLDPGHGGTDPGAVNEAYGLLEKDINLDVAYRLKALLEGDGATVVMTREDDASKSNSDRYTFCNDEQATILVSIHTNSVTDPTWDGAMALYGPREEPVLAQAIYDYMYPFLRDRAPAGVDFRDFGVDRFASGVLFKSDMPAAMMEPLFMSNPAEASLLVTPIYDDGVVNTDCRRDQIAQAIYGGILAYFGPTSPTPTPKPGGKMHVAGIEMSLEQKGVWTSALAAVQIVDDDGTPVAGATVTGGWTGAAPGAGEVVSDENGVATFSSARTRDTAGNLIFTVDGVVKEGWTYSPEDNVKTSASIDF